MFLNEFDLLVFKNESYKVKILKKIDKKYYRLNFKFVVVGQTYNGTVL